MKVKQRYPPNANNIYRSKDHRKRKNKEGRSSSSLKERSAVSDDDWSS